MIREPQYYLAKQAFLEGISSWIKKKISGAVSSAVPKIDPNKILQKLDPDQVAGLIDKIPPEYLQKMIDNYLSKPGNIDHLVEKYGPQVWEAGKKKFMNGGVGSFMGALGGAGDAANWWLNQTKQFGGFMGKTLFGEENYNKLFGGADTGAAAGGQAGNAAPSVVPGSP